MGKYTLSSVSVSRDAALRQYLPFVRRIALRIQDNLPNANAFDDLVQAGMIAVWQMVQQSSGWTDSSEEMARLSVRARGAMLDCLREADWVPRRLRQKQREMEKNAAAFFAERQQMPTNAELAERLGWSLDEYHQHLVDMGRAAPFFLEDVVPTHDSDVPEAKAVSHSERVTAKEIREALSVGLMQLPEKERTALALYYYEELTLDEVANVMGFQSKSYVLKLVNGAVIKLRAYLAESDPAKLSLRE